MAQQPAASLQQPLLREPVEEQLHLLHCPSSTSVVRVDLATTCPGCALELRKRSRLGIPKKELFFVAVMTLCNVLPVSVLFPFIYFMVEDFHIAVSDERIAFYAGFIGSAFMVGRFVSATPWGMVADKYGRKPVMIYGTASIVLFNSLFGFSTTFWMALMSRFLLGVFNGLLGTIRAYIPEICKEEEQGLGMSLVGTLWGLGLIVGPALGGYLAQPSINYPGIFPRGSIFDTFPYALPCLCISCFAVMSFAISLIMPESLHKHSSQTGTKSDSLEETKAKPLSKNWGFVSSNILYCIWSLHDMAYTEVFSLWAVSPNKLFGLEMTSVHVGTVLSISGCSLLCFQMLLYPIAERWLGPIQTCRISAILTVPLVAVHPLISRLHGSWLWVIVTVASCVKNILSVAVMTSSFILLNHSVTSSQCGVANGISMSFMSLFKAVGPASAGVLLSWSESRTDTNFLPGAWMVFTILALLCLLTIFFTIHPVLPRSLDHPNLEVYGVEESSVLQRQASFHV